MCGCMEGVHGAFGAEWKGFLLVTSSERVRALDRSRRRAAHKLQKNDMRREDYHGRQSSSITNPQVFCLLVSSERRGISL